MGVISFWEVFMQNNTKIRTETQGPVYFSDFHSRKSNKKDNLVIVKKNKNEKWGKWAAML